MAAPRLSCGSVRKLPEAIGSRQVPNGAGAVLCDLGAWPFTPYQEQRAPAAATGAAGVARPGRAPGRPGRYARGNRPAGRPSGL